MWHFNVSFLANAAVHKWHLCGLGSVWARWCLLRFLSAPNLAPHWEHSYDSSRVCVDWCRVSEIFWAKRLPQVGHWYGISPACFDIMCRRTHALRTNITRQMWHMWGPAPLRLRVRRVSGPGLTEFCGPARMRGFRFTGPVSCSDPARLRFRCRGFARTSVGPGSLKPVSLSVASSSSDGSDSVVSVPTSMSLEEVDVDSRCLALTLPRAFLFLAAAVLEARPRPTFFALARGRFERVLFPSCLVLFSGSFFFLLVSHGNIP